jgi:K+-transporting ATPase ATPase A chain
MKGSLEIITYYLIITILSYPLGKWLAFCLKSNNKSTEMTWKQYCLSVLSFSFISFIFLILILKYQNLLPLNGANHTGLSWALSFNTAASFVTNTNWQAYGGEATLSVFSQTFGLCVQNFLSAAVGLSVLAVLIRGLVNKENNYIGNFWQDLRSIILYFLLPLSTTLSVLLIIEGVPQTLKAKTQIYSYESSAAQDIPLGMVASQIAIKQLGTNGGGYYNVNSAHPLENPTPLSNMLQMLSILLIPAACCHALGILIKDQRQGWALYLVMLFIALSSTFLTCYFEHNPNSKYFPENVASNINNMEGKETRFGIVNSSIWAVATTAASNGSVNSMHDSFTPLGGLIPLLMMQLGEVIFGGVGSGLYGMIAFVIVTVFISGLMIGRTPEYLGKKIDAYDIKMASIVVLIPCILVLVGTAVGLDQGVRLQILAHMDLVKSYMRILQWEIITEVLLEALLQPILYTYGLVL